MSKHNLSTEELLTELTFRLNETNATDAQLRMQSLEGEIFRLEDACAKQRMENLNFSRTSEMK